MTTLRTAALVTALVASAATGAHAGGKVPPPRRETRTASYLLPAPAGIWNEHILGTVHLGGVYEKAPAWARYVSVSVTDDTGVTLPFNVMERYNATNRDRGTYCDRTPGWVPITPSSETWVTVFQDPCPGGNVDAVATKGTVTLVYSDTR